MVFEGVEVAGPILAVAVQPLVDLMQTVRAEGVDAPLGVGSDLDEAGFAQDAQVARHGGLGQLRQQGHQVAGWAGAVAEGVEQSAAVRLGYGLEGVHSAYITPRAYNESSI